jgi:hypothetical protein
LTTGSHFRAAKMAARHRWKSASIVGLFIARTCPRWRHCAGGPCADEAHGRAGPLSMAHWSHG